MDHQPSQPIEIERVLFAAAAGDGSAWQIVIDRYAERVFALIRAQGIDPELAEEITQSTFATVAAKLGDYAELGKFEPWLFRIAMNRLRDEMRRKKRHARPVDHISLIAMAGEVRKPAATADDADLTQLRAAMTALSETDREVIQLRHYAGLSFKQIAELLDQPLGTVLARQHRALAKLADLMQAANPSQPQDSHAMKGPQRRSQGGRDR
ncbi:MAG: RNA polymerase sigma factor [Phycisphaerales bacterium]